MTEPIIEWGKGENVILDRLRAGGVPVDECYQCLRCSAGCPVLPFMDFAPNRIVRMIQYGMDDQILSSHCIWMCASCHTCTTRCPNGVDIAHMMDLLRQEAVRRKVPCPESDVETFHRCFVEEVRRGRVHELSLIARYKLRSGRFRDDMKLGMQMFRRGKIKLLPERFAGASEVRALFKRTQKGD